MNFLVSHDICQMSSLWPQLKIYILFPCLICALFLPEFCTPIAPRLCYVCTLLSYLACCGPALTLCLNPEGNTCPLARSLVNWFSEGTFLFHSPPLRSAPHGEWSKSHIFATFKESVTLRLGHLRVLICLFGEHLSSPLFFHWHFKAPQLLREQKQRFQQIWVKDRKVKWMLQELGFLLPKRRLVFQFGDWSGGGSRWTEEGAETF